ncbi:WD repeat-containing protein 88 isoform X1 [Lampetra fluviatilis]
MSLAVTSAGAELARVRTGQWEHEPLSKLPFKVLRGHAGCINCCHFGFGDTRAVTCSEDHTAKIWDTETGRILKSFDDAHQDNITECSVNSTRGRLLTVSWDKAMKLWDLETGKLLMCETHAWPLTCCDASGDGRLLATATAVDRSLRLWDVDSCSLVVQRNDHHEGALTGCRFDCGAQRVVTSSYDRSFKVWDLATRVATVSVAGSHANVLSDCRFSAGGRLVATASWDRTLRLWDVRTGAFREDGPLELRGGHGGSVSSCAFSSDASLLVSGGLDRRAVVWDAATGSRGAVLKGHTDWVMDVDVSADKRWVLTASKDRTMRLWNIENMDRIPAVMGRESENESRVLQCEACRKPFPAMRRWGTAASSSSAVSRCSTCRSTTTGDALRRHEAEPHGP